MIHRIITFSIVSARFRTKRGLFLFLAHSYSYVINFCRDVVSIPEYIEDGKNLCEETVKDMQDENKIMTKEKVPAFVISRYEKVCHRLSSPFVGTNHYFYQYGASLSFAF